MSSRDSVLSRTSARIHKKSLDYLYSNVNAGGINTDSDEDSYKREKKKNRSTESLIIKSCMKSWVNEQDRKVSQLGGEEGCHKSLAD